MYYRQLGHYDSKMISLLAAKSTYRRDSLWNLLTLQIRLTQFCDILEKYTNLSKKKISP